MSPEEIELDNLKRYERMLIEKHGELSRGLEGNINRIKSDLSTYEIDDILLTRVSDVLYEVVQLDDIREVETEVKHLVDTFWNQI